jgi:copper chaperone CopZ
MSTTSSFVVSGMTCEHCVSSVTEQVSALEGVSGVKVDLQSGQLSVSGTGVTDDSVRRAVVDAGYQAL